MSDSLNNKELVAVGYQFAKALSSDTPIIDMAKMFTRLAERLGCTTAALREMTKQRDAQSTLDIKKLARELVENLVDCDGADDDAVKQYLTWTEKTCRAAMNQGKNNQREMIRTDHAQWSQETFGGVGPIGPLKHLSKEALEAAAAPGDLSEWADMQFLLWDAQRRAGITDEQINLAMFEKLKVNKARQWPEPKDGEPRLHIIVTPQQEKN